MQSLHSDVGGGFSVRAARDPGAYPALSQGDQGQEQSPGTDPATQRSLQVPSAKGPFWAGAPSSAGSLPSLGVHCTPPGPWQTRRPQTYLFTVAEGVLRPPAPAEAAVALPEVGDHAQVSHPPGLHPEAVLLPGAGSIPTPQHRRLHPDSPTLAPHSRLCPAPSEWAFR